MWRLYAGIGLCMVLAAGGWYLHHRGYESGRAVGAKQVSALKLSQARALSKARADAQATIHKQAQRFADIAKKYEQEKADTQAHAARVIAALRAGNLRLRDEWTCPDVPKPPARAGKPDDATQRRRKGAANLIQIAKQQDAKIRALQHILRTERAKHP